MNIRRQSQPSTPATIEAMIHAHPQGGLQRSLTCKRAKRRRPGGFALSQLLVALLASVGLAGVLGYSYIAISRGNSKAQQSIQSNYYLQQAANILANSSVDSDGDGIVEPPAGAIAYSDGYQVPAGSAAVKKDAWGNNLLYCPWDNGVTNSSTGRLAGVNPTSTGSAVLAVISAGSNGTLQTTCASARSTGLASGDDLLRLLSVAQVVEGLNGSVYYGNPVAAVAALDSLPAVYPGQIRAVTGTNELYINATGGAGSGMWSKLGSSSNSAICPNASYTSHAGETSIAVIIGTYTNAKLISGVNADGLWYYAVDLNGNGSHTSADVEGHDFFLDAIFTQDVNGVNGGGGNTNDTYRYATLALKSGTGTVRVALPTYGSTLSGGNAVTGFFNGTSVSGTGINPTYDGFLAIWDSLNGTSTVTGWSGVPPGWVSNGAYATATPTATGHAVIRLDAGSVSNGSDGSTSNFIALQVL